MVLQYKIALTLEEVDENENTVRLLEENIPFRKEVWKDFQRNWETAKIENTFDGILQGKIKSCKPVLRLENGVAYAVIQIVPVNGFRWTANRREALWQQLDAQMVDGFGESLDHSTIEGVPEKYRYYL